MTYKILTDDTQRVVCRSSVRPATESDPNLRLDLFRGEDDEDVHEFLKSKETGPPQGE